MKNQFFSENGLTSTSANHVANLAKEYIEAKKQKINAITFINTEVSAGGQTYTVGQATSKPDIESISNLLNDIDQATRLIAWLREALKAKEDLKVMDIYEWAEIHSKILPQKPVKLPIIHEEDIIATWDIEKYNSYFAYQTRATVIGEYIHPKGNFSKARQRAEEVRNTPYLVTGEGRDLTITHYTVPYTSEQIDELFLIYKKNKGMLKLNLTS